MSFSSEPVCFSSNASCDFHCMWKITYFSQKHGENIVSESFKPQENSPEFCLSIQPRVDVEGFISCFLVRPNSTSTQCKTVFLKVSSFSLRNSADKIIRHVESDEWNVYNVGEGSIFQIQIEKNELFDKLIDDELILCANATYCSTCLKDLTGITYLVETSPKENLIENYKLLLTNQQMVDSELLLTVRKKKLPVHSLILSARSKSFEETFEKFKIVEIPDFCEDVIHCMIEFIYTGNIKIMTFDIAMELLRAADTFQVESLKLYCGNYLTPMLNDKNIVHVLMDADKYSATKLRTAAIRYFGRCKKSRKILSEYPELKENPGILTDILDAIARAGK